MATHEATNRSTLLLCHDAAIPDVALTDGLVRHGGADRPDGPAGAGRMAGPFDTLPSGSDVGAIIDRARPIHAGCESATKPGVAGDEP